MQLNLLQNLIKRGETVAVALSGGKDSTALLFALNQLKNTLGFTLKAINVEHGIRGQESLSDTKFCIKFATDLGIEIKTFSVDAVTYSKQNSLTEEEGARILRYECFMKAVKSGFCDKVATAHHKRDLCETILFNLFRGSGLSGAKGLLPNAYNDTIIRPMLYTSKQEVDLYVDYHHIPYVTDSTNDNLDYSRNYIRNKIIPAIEDRFPSFEDSLQRFSVSCKEDDEYLLSQAQTFIEYFDGYVKVKFCEKPIFSRATILALKYIGIEKDFTSTHINDIFNLISLQKGKEITLPQGLKAIREDDCIAFYSDDINKTDFCFNFKVGKFCTRLFEFEVKTSDFSEWQNSNKCAYSAVNGDFCFKELFIDADKIPPCAILRTVNQDDIFTTFSSHTKPVKKYLTDKKIGKVQRNNLLILADQNNIYAILGVEISPLCKIDENTKNILKLTCKVK